jgi:tetratricopeptide (TPR) repeat protein
MTGSRFSLSRNDPGKSNDNKKSAVKIGLNNNLKVYLFLVGVLTGTSSGGTDSVSLSKPNKFAGSRSCRECHENFYQLWSTSFHGLALQPYTAEFAAAKLTPQKGEIAIGKIRYQAEIGGKEGWIIEKGTQSGDRKYPMVHVLGGKNVCYFLTLLDKGRLQVLPLAYDVRKKEWFDTAASGVRHFPGQQGADAPLSWRDQEYTFNTACYSCHVSQLSTNYDLKTDTYHTAWSEPGINCETCHGPSEEHNRLLQETPKGTVPADLKILRTKTMTVQQRNDLCASCHAKANQLTAQYPPGESFFDHFDLVTLENPDYYPDGRDLGENYTFTSWRMSPCVKSGKLDCLHCHTSSGRYRFMAEEKANDACLPCHRDRVEKSVEHTHHKADGAGNKCIACHMPMTDFARMRRSDHSMLPPTPAATIASQSPNACNLCHTDKDAAWSDQRVKSWSKLDYQAPILQRAGLITAARKRDWKKLPEMLAYLNSGQRDEIFTTSLIRLLHSCNDPVKWTGIIKAMEDPSPLVQGAAAEALADRPLPEAYKVLVGAIQNKSRLVRIRAAASLAGYPADLIKESDRTLLARATGEYLNSILVRPDFWSSHYNLGNYYLQKNELPLALSSYEMAEKLDPRAIMPFVNASIVHARMGNSAKAEESLNQALGIDPKNAVAGFNMGLLKAEMGNGAAAESYLRGALKSDPTMAEAAYNLGILLASDHIQEAVEWSRKAYSLKPDTRYGCTLAYYLCLTRETDKALDILHQVVARAPNDIDAHLLMAEIYKNQGKLKEAEAILRKALDQDGLAENVRLGIERELKELMAREQSER